MESKKPVNRSQLRGSKVDIPQSQSRTVVPTPNYLKPPQKTLIPKQSSSLEIGPEPRTTQLIDTYEPSIHDPEQIPIKPLSSTPSQPDMKAKSDNIEKMCAEVYTLKPITQRVIRENVQLSQDITKYKELVDQYKDLLAKQKSDYDHQINNLTTKLIEIEEALQAKVITNQTLSQSLEDKTHALDQLQGEFESLSVKHNLSIAGFTQSLQTLEDQTKKTLEEYQKSLKDLDDRHKEAMKVRDDLATAELAMVIKERDGLRQHLDDTQQSLAVYEQTITTLRHDFEELSQRIGQLQKGEATHDTTTAAATTSSSLSSSADCPENPFITVECNSDSVIHNNNNHDNNNTQAFTPASTPTAMSLSTSTSIHKFFHQLQELLQSRQGSTHIHSDGDDMKGMNINSSGMERQIIDHDPEALPAKSSVGLWKKPIAIGKLTFTPLRFGQLILCSVLLIALVVLFILTLFL